MKIKEQELDHLLLNMSYDSFKFIKIKANDKN